MSTIVYIGTDFEAQSLAAGGSRNLYPFVERHFRYSCLLADKVYMPIANVYQSELTRTLRRLHQPLFLDADSAASSAQFSISKSKNKFKEDVEDKRSTYPHTGKYNSIYNEPDQLSEITKELSDLTPHRRGGRMVNALKDVVTSETAPEGLIHQAVLHCTGSKEDTTEIFRPLLRAVNEQKYAIVPEYVEMLAQPDLMTDYYREIYEFILLKAYCQSCETLYHGFCNNPLVIYYAPLFRESIPYQLDFRDTLLFDAFLDTIPVLREYILQIDDVKLLQLKWSFAFQQFKQMYIAFVQALGKVLCLKDVSGLFHKVRKEAQKLVAHEKDNLISELLNLICNYNDAAVFYQSLRHLFSKGNLVYRHLNAVNLPDYLIHHLLQSIDAGFIDQYERELYEKYLANAARRKENQKFMNKPQNSYEITINGSHNITTAGEHNIGVITKDTTVGNQDTELAELLALQNAELEKIEQFLSLPAQVPQQDIAAKESLSEATVLLKELVEHLKQKEEFKAKKSLNKWAAFREKCPEACLKTLAALANISSIAGTVSRIFFGG